MEKLITDSWGLSVWDGGYTHHFPQWELCALSNDLPIAGNW
jgi:hypothetical protein